jgi:hypothetical protein
MHVRQCLWDSCDAVLGGGLLGMAAAVAMHVKLEGNGAGHVREADLMIITSLTRE